MLKPSVTYLVLDVINQAYLRGVKLGFFFFLPEKGCLFAFPPATVSLNSFLGGNIMKITFVMKLGCVATFFFLLI